MDNKEIQEAWKANGLPEPQMLNINGLEAMLLYPIAKRSRLSLCTIRVRRASES